MTSTLPCHSKFFKFKKIAMIRKKQHEALQAKYCDTQKELVQALFFSINSSNEILREKTINILTDLNSKIFTDKLLEKIFQTLKDNYDESSLSIKTIAKKTEEEEVSISVLLEEGVYSCTPKEILSLYKDFKELYKSMFCAKLLVESYNDIMETQSAKSFEKNVVYKASQLPAIVSNDTNIKTVDVLASELMDTISNAKGLGDVCRTGLKTFDESYFGLLPSMLYIIAARFGVGKTILGLNWLYNIVFVQKKKAAFFSLEMEEQSLYQRLIATKAGIPPTFIKRVSLDGYNPDYPNEEYHNNFQKLGEALGSMEEYKDKLFLITKHRELSAIIAKAVMLKHRYGIEAIFIDYIQRVRTKGENQKVELAKSIDAFLSLAQDLEIPIIVLSQIGREGTGQGSTPTSDNLAGADELGRVPDYVIIIDKKRDKTEGHLRIDKARHGESSKIPIELNRKTLTFEEKTPYSF
jgi:replicative DNA helicase